jgi:hypothetical protein
VRSRSNDFNVRDEHARNSLSRHPILLASIGVPPRRRAAPPHIVPGGAEEWQCEAPWIRGSLLKTLEARQYRVKPRTSSEHSPKIEPKFPVRFNEFFKLRTLTFRFDRCAIAKDRASAADVSAIRTEQWKVEHDSAWIINYRRLDRFIEENHKSYRAFM